MSVLDCEPKRRDLALESADSSDAMPDTCTRRPDRERELAEICRKHHAALVRFLSNRTGSAEDAKEILQESYAKLLALDRPGAISLLVGYLWRTAVNLAMDRKRNQALQARVFRSMTSLSETRGSSAEEIVESRERLALVERGISELPPRCREAFVLHLLNGLTFEEVGREMRVSTRMAQKHVARALEHLKSCLDAGDKMMRVR